MRITFTEDHISVASGNSKYKAGDTATLRRGKELVDMGVAREGWNVEEQGELLPTSPPDLSPGRKVVAYKNVKALAAKHNLLLYSVVGTGKNGRITLEDVEALIVKE